MKMNTNGATVLGSSAMFPPSIESINALSYHLCKFQDHGPKAADVSVVPGVHHAQVGTESAQRAISFT